MSISNQPTGHTMQLDTDNAHDQSVITKLNSVLNQLSDDSEILDETLRWLDDQELSDLSDHLIERFGLAETNL